MPRTTTKFGRNRSSGFTLVELAMASFLVAVGLLAVFALLRRGIDTGGFSEEEIRETLFAETAFATLRAAADNAASTNGWTAFWDAFERGDARLPLPGAFRETLPRDGDEEPAPLLMGTPDDEWNAALFSGWPTGDGDAMAVSNTVWYHLSITNISTYAHVQIHMHADRPREESRTAFSIIPNQTGRPIREARRRTDPRESTDEDDGGY